MDNADITDEMFHRAKNVTACFIEEAAVELFNQIPWEKQLVLMSKGVPVEARITQCGSVHWHAEDNPFRTSVVLDPDMQAAIEQWDREHGRPRFTIDVTTPDGHIEFTVSQTGWGGMI